MGDDLDVPSCPVHLERLHVAGVADDGHDARWECRVPGCTWAQIV